MDSKYGVPPDLLIALLLDSHIIGVNFIVSCLVYTVVGLVVYHAIVYNQVKARFVEDDCY